MFQKNITSTNTPGCIRGFYDVKPWWWIIIIIIKVLTIHLPAWSNAVQLQRTWNKYPCRHPTEISHFSSHKCSLKVSSSKIKFLLRKMFLNETLVKPCKRSVTACSLGLLLAHFFMSQPWVENHCHLTSMLQTNSCRGVFFVSVITKCQVEAKYQEDEAPSTYWTS